MTNIDELVIDRSNFRQNRRAYGITLTEISDKSKISSSVISNFENFTGQYTQTRVRDDNQRAIIRALKDLIQERIDSTFLIGDNNSNNNINNKKEKESKIMNEATKEISLSELAKATATESKEKKESNYCTVGYNKETIVPKLRKYCKENNLGMTEFCDMCGVSRTMLSPYYIKIAPVMREDILRKICRATGLDIALFNEDRNDGQAIESKIVKENNIKEIKTEAPKKDIIPIESHKITPNITNSDDVQIRDKKLTFQDGQYFEEYTEVRVVRKAITREQFLAAV